MNSNGEHLLHALRDNKVVITNTCVPNKVAYKATWTSPDKNTSSHSDSIYSRNPYRNQIDYIIVKISQNCLVKGARSYGGFATVTDQMKMSLQGRNLPKISPL